jgi:hypothetical protein
LRNDQSLYECYNRHSLLRVASMASRLTCWEDQDLQRGYWPFKYFAVSCVPCVPCTGNGDLTGLVSCTSICSEFGASNSESDIAQLCRSLRQPVSPSYPTPRLDLEGGIRLEPRKAVTSGVNSRGA